MASLGFGEDDGVWRTIGGRKVFIREGESISSAMKRSGKFKSTKKKNEYTKEELKEKYGTDDTDIINAGKEQEERVSAKESDEKKEGLQLSDKQKETGEKSSQNGEKGQIKDFAKIDDNTYLPIRENETKEEVIEKYNERQKGYRNQLKSDVVSNLNGQKTAVWDQDLIDTYIEMKDSGELKKLGLEEEKFDRSMKNMGGEPLYSPDRTNKELSSSGSNKEKISSEDFNKKMDTEYNRLKNREIDTKEYFKRTDDIENNYTTDRKIKGNEPNTEWKTPSRSGNEKYTVDYFKEKGVEVRDTVPEGWQKLEGATTAPNGYEWYNNGKSRFGGEYKNALVKKENTNDSINSAIRRKAYQKYLKEHPASKMTFEDFKDMSKMQ